MNDQDKTQDMSMAERREKGLLWVDTGENMGQQAFARGLCQEFNHTKAEEADKREEIWKKLFASCGKDVWIEPPLTLAMGNTVSIGEGTYINSNLTLVDDYKIEIGKGAVIGAGSVVMRDVPPMCFAAGVPCKVIREITDEDLQEFEPIINED